MGWTGFEKVFERVAGHGEDAAALCSWAPLARVVASDGHANGTADRPFGVDVSMGDEAGAADEALVCAGVFDGLGGLGARVLATPDGPLTEARAASRAAADALTAFVRDEGLGLRAAFAACVNEQELLAVAVDVRRRLEQAFDAAFAALHARLGGVLLPTNGAVVLRVSACSGRRFAVCLWAGDARCYLLEPSEGLHQLSRDDNGAGLDALADLRSGAPSPQTRRLGWDVAASGGTRLGLSVVELGAPAVLFACSDGVYAAGVRSPMHFELLLWRWVLEGTARAVGPDIDAAGLASADVFTSTNDLVQRHWERCAQDDCSLAGVFSGEADEDWRARANARMHDVYDRYIRGFPALPGSGAPEQDRAAAEAAIDALWETYRPTYECYIAHAREDR